MPGNEPLNFETELRRLARRDPFLPFTIILTSGDRYEVAHDWQLVMSPEGSGAVYYSLQQGFCFFRKNQVVAVNVHEPAT